MAVLPALASAKESRADSVLQGAITANQYFMTVHPDPTVPTFVKKERPSSLWTRGVYYEGLCALNDVQPSEAYMGYMTQWADFHRWTPRNGVKTMDADDQCCAQTYVYLYDKLGGSDRLEAVKTNLDIQMKSGRNDYWTWIDAIQMAMPVYAQMYRITGESRYLDYAMRSYIWTRDTCGGKLFNTKEGLWWRDKDFVPPYKEPDGSNCYWSRGNGWVYAALVRVMNEIPSKGAHYKLLKKDFIAMSKALQKSQRPDGYWNVSLVCPTNYGGPELTGTALFLYGMSWGLQKGYIKGKAYRQACDRAWWALKKLVHANGFLGYVQGTGKEPKDGQPLSMDKQPDFDDFGLGCYLLGATEYYKLLKAEQK
jgi:rhamnogalacturonyl hydrolase YesR